MDKPKYKLLIIDDDKVVRDAINQKFTSEGFEVVSAENGQEGIGVARDEKPDIVLLDIQMPVMNGIETLEAIRNEDWGKEMKIMMLTNSSDIGNVAEGLSFDVNDYMVKADWKLKDVVLKVKESLGE